MESQNFPLLVFFIVTVSVNRKSWLYHSHKKRKDSLETQAELVVLRTYVENQVIIEPILLYRASNCKQTKEQDREDCLWTHMFTFYVIIVSFISFFCQDANKTISHCV